MSKSKVIINLKPAGTHNGLYRCGKCNEEELIDRTHLYTDSKGTDFHKCLSCGHTDAFPDHHP